jgi:membrane protease YdiL (CAAX protease family)
VTSEGSAEARKAPEGEARSEPPTEERRFGNRRSLEENSLEDRVARKLRGFGLLGIVSILIILGGNLLFVPLSAILVLVWAWISHSPWRDLGFVRPRSWATTIAVGIAFGVALKFAMKAIVMPLLGAPPVNGPFHFLAHNPAEIPSMLYVILIGAGFGEEVIFRGWAFERFGKLLGPAPWAKAVTVLFTSAWFAQEHYGLQGMAGVQNALVVGLVFGTVFAVTGRIFLVMIAHVAFDLAAYVMIYWDWETAVAHIFFK